ncbi:hypothetical protein EUX98_g8631 [Antrodiella citrinella]|uniref:MYND-type domain-containing protein n=1 Tax=Antrodiella citrinella TaxID=2447956 RepID=A0A4V3XG66_9APHY|nr:hypothetical protein EUX98_g8631 [Antrodiella citrinella]
MNRSTEALHQVEDQLLEHKEHMRRQKSVHQNVPWIDNIELYSLYGDMLVLNQKFDIRLRVLLENVIESAGHPFNTTTPNVVAYACIAHMHLGLLLQLMGEQSDKQKWHVQYAAEYFRRSPAGIEDTVDMFLRRKTSPRHPVYIALGEQWMKDHPLIRNSKNGCHVIYYCSRECQKANWKSHKKACKEDAEARKNLSDHKASEDVTNWQQSSHYANKDAMIHALNLQRDPSRGRTHMIFRSLNYVSEGEELKDRVRVVRCSIYKVEDILDDLLLFHTGHITSRDDFREAMKQTIASTLGEPDNSDEDSGVGDQPAQIPIIHLTTGAGIRGAAVNVGEWVQRFEGLFQFCIYVQIKDVPDDILEDMIIISKVFLFHMDEQLGGVFPSREAYRLSELVRMKLVVYFTPTCNGYVQERKFLEALQKIDPRMARQAADMSKWRNGDHYANLDAMIHALNLQRDPSRGKTHIIFRTLENTPGPRVPKDYRDRIRVTRCTVFKVEDILGDMCQLSEGRPRPNKEEIFKEIQAAIAVALQELPNGEPDPNAPPRSNWSKSSRDIPVLDFTFGPGFHPVVNAVPVSEDYVRGLKYNPNWRQVINGDQGTPPRPFIAPSGALDAEHTF